PRGLVLMPSAPGVIPGPTQGSGPIRGGVELTGFNSVDFPPHFSGGPLAPKLCRLSRGEPCISLFGKLHRHFLLSRCFPIRRFLTVMGEFLETLPLELLDLRKIHQPSWCRNHGETSVDVAIGGAEF